MNILKSKNAIRDADAQYINDLQLALLSQQHNAPRWLLYLITLLVVVVLGWASVARVEEVTRGEAKIVAKNHEQIIQSLEGGLLAEMLVTEGDVVKAGQVILKIDPTRAEASYREALSRIVGLKATLSRLRAEAFNLPLHFADDINAPPEVLARETQAYEARRIALNDSITALESNYRLALREVTLGEPLVKKGLLSEVEWLRMKRQASDIQLQIAERKNRYQADANTELTRLELELAQLQENIVGRSDVLERTMIAAPVHGIVKNVRVTTIGGVIQPGEPILEIIPFDDQLLVETKIKPADVAFLKPGLPATVKITAYDFGIYGGLEGKVVLLSPDTLEDENRTAGQKETAYYRVMVLTDKSFLEKGGNRLPIIPGMLASVDIRTGEKTILDYLLKPLFKAQEAFRER